MNKYQIEGIVSSLVFFYYTTVIIAFAGVFAILHDPRFIHSAKTTGDYSWFNYWLPALTIYGVISSFVLYIIGKWSERNAQKTTEH